MAEPVLVALGAVLIGNLASILVMGLSWPSIGWTRVFLGIHEGFVLVALITGVLLRKGLGRRSLPAIIGGALALTVLEAADWIFLMSRRRPAIEPFPYLAIEALLVVVLLAVFWGNSGTGSPVVAKNAASRS